MIQITWTTIIWFLKSRRGHLKARRTVFYAGIILGMGSANERRHCYVMLSLIGWAHTQNNACMALHTHHENFKFLVFRPPINLTHWGWDKMVAIFRTTFSNAFSWMKMYKFCFRLSLFPINNISALVQIMAWRRPGDELLSEPMMVSLLMHICVTPPQWFRALSPNHTSLYTQVLQASSIFIRCGSRTNELWTKDHWTSQCLLYPGFALDIFKMGPETIWDTLET